MRHYSISLRQSLLNRITVPYTLLSVFLLLCCIPLFISCRQAQDKTTIFGEAHEDPSTIDVRIFQNQELQSKLNQLIEKKPVWKKLIESKKMGLSIMDISHSTPRYAQVNDLVMMYAASLPKIAILLAAEDQIACKQLKETAELDNDLKQMIAKSSNSAATRVIDRIGLDTIQSILINKYGFYRPKENGGLWVGKRYGSGGKIKRDPLKNLSHAANTAQVCSFYYQLYKGKLISKERSEHMLSILEDPELHHKLVNGIEQVDPNAKIYRKSGTWKNWHADSALVEIGGKTYIIAVLIESSKGESIIRNMVDPVFKILGTSP